MANMSEILMAILSVAGALTWLIVRMIRSSDD